MLLAIQQAPLVGNDAANQGLGWSVALTGDTAVIGAYRDDIGSNGDQSSAYVFSLDLVAPVTVAGLAPEANAAGWHTSAVTVDLAAADASGIDKTHHRLGTSGPFIQYNPAAKPTVTAEGSTTIEYYCADLAGNTETAKSLTVRIDKTAPTTTASGIASGWSKSPVTATFNVTDASSGMSGGGAKTEYSIDGGASWTTGASVAISAEGSTTLEYGSTDAAGNTEAAKSATVRIDSAKPTTKAYAATVKKGKKVELTYRVNDATPGCGQAKITLKVYATDMAGNVQSKVGSAKLTVR